MLALIGLRWLLPSSALGSWLVARSYDSLYALSPNAAPGVSTSSVVLVYLDLESHNRLDQNPTRPWDRRLHARLVDRLTQAGARAVVFDIVFGNPDPDPAADRELAAAFARNGHVILAGEYNSRSDSKPGMDAIAIQSLSPPCAVLTDVAAGWGLAYLKPDNDFVVREHFEGLLPEEEPSLVWAVARHLGLPLAKAGAPRASRWMQYYGPPFTLPNLSYHEALSTADGERLFRNKIVWVGARPIAGAWRERLDQFRGPNSAWDSLDQFYPGVEVHATQLLNLVRGDWLRRSSPLAESAWVLALALALPWMLLRLRPLTATAVAVGLEILLAVAAGVAFARFQLWTPWLVAAVGIVPLGLVTSVAGQSIQWYRERRQYHAKIREQAELITKAQDAILVQDLAGQVRFANPAAARLYGWSEAELSQPEVAAQLWPASDETVQTARRVARECGEWLGELTQATRRGVPRTVQSRWTLIRDAAGRPDSLLVINTDITERKELEAQFLRAQRMDTIGSLAGGMVHDLNNALAPILMGVQWLRRRGGDDEARKMFDIIEANTHRGADMARQVLLLARGRAADKERLAPAHLIQELQRILASTFPSTIRLGVLVPPDVWPIRGNTTQLHQTLLNLCVNARDAMPDGGELTLAVDNVELGADEAAALPRGRTGAFVMFVVSDTGTGIPAELIPRLFDPFVTTKPVGQGTGLGLASVARIVEGHDGFVALRSEVGVGTTFEVYLPRAAEEAAAESAANASPVPRGDGRTVLLVEDEVAAREVLRTVLQDAGYRVLVGIDGADGLARLEQHSGDHLDVIVADREMPRCGGRPMLAEIWKRRGPVPAILMSGHAPADDAETPVPAGATLAFLAKPFDADQLLRLTGRVIAEAQVKR